MQYDEFANLRLVGGTALALQIGHRKSVDLDLFGDIDFENINNTKVFSQFDKIVTLKKSKNINILSIDDIKLDFVNYSYPWLQKYLHFDGIRLAGIEDIAAMKLAAITGRGTRKDFVDIYFILQKYQLKEIVDFYKRKYFDGSVYLVLKSLTYFEDAENDVDVDMIHNVKWDEIKLYILETVNLYNQSIQ
jgi:hypothetical protein